MGQGQGSSRQEGMLQGQLDPHSLHQCLDRGPGLAAGKRRPRGGRVPGALPAIMDSPPETRLSSAPRALAGYSAQPLLGTQDMLGT